jgi:hypothetical protein
VLSPGRLVLSSVFPGRSLVEGGCWVLGAGHWVLEGECRDLEGEWRFRRRVLVLRGECWFCGRGVSAEFWRVSAGFVEGGSGAGVWMVSANLWKVLAGGGGGGEC